MKDEEQRVKELKEIIRNSDFPDAIDHLVVRHYDSEKNFLKALEDYVGRNNLEDPPTVMNNADRKQYREAGFL